MKRVASIGWLGLIACQATLEVGGSLPSPSSNPNNRDGSVDASVDGSSDAAIGLDLGFDDGGVPIDGGFQADAMVTDLGPGGDGGEATDGGDAGVVSSIFQGSFVITNELDRRMIAPYTEITGDLAIHAPGMSEVVLPTLLRIGGHLLGDNNPDLVRISMPLLVEIGTDFKIYEDALLETIDLPTLARIGEDVRIGLTAGVSARTNPKLASIALPALVEVGGELQISFNGANLLVDPLSMGGLAMIDLPALETVGYGLEIANNAALLDFDLSSLAHADERVCTGGIGSCLKLHDVTVSANFQLPECRVTALEQQLRARGYAGTVYTGYNDDDGVCN